MHHYILWLIELVNVFSIKTCTTMLKLILDIEKILNKVNFIESINTTDDTTAATNALVTQTSNENNTDENLLRVWYIDSKNYSNLNNLSIDFNCIGASRYNILFDDVCEIKNNIDLFEFIDSDDEHHTCNGYKVGCDSWKNELNINSHNYLKFNLITQKTIVPLEENIKIKFTIKAYGYGNASDDTATTAQNKNTNSTINDLRTSITCLIGIYCSHIYTQRLSKFENNKDSSNKSKLKESSEDNKEKELKQEDGGDDNNSSNSDTYTANEVKVEDINLTETQTKDENCYYFDMNSNIYKTLLRGGLVEINSDKHKLVRSYSGMHESIGMNDKMNTFLFNLSENNSEIPLIKEFLKLYELHNEKVNKPKIGGIRVNKAILSIFAALIWHTPVIKRNDLVDDEDEDEAGYTKPINEHIAEAYKAAELTRMIIVEQQQLSKISGFFNAKETNTTDKNDSDDEEENYEDFIDMITQKATYLLKISRLNKIPMKSELYNDYDESDKCNLISKSRIKKSNHHQNSLNTMKVSNNLTTSTSTTSTLRLPKNDAYPTFNLIIEFIFDKLINLKLISKILNHKKQNAKSIAESFKIAKEYLEINLEQHQPAKTQQLECVLTFLSSFFNLKPQQYGIHYLQNLYGCGLNLEKLVREAYYEFLKLIFNFIKIYQVNHENGTITPFQLDIYIRIESYLLHLFNIDWELYDWKFLYDIKLEDFLIKNCYLNLSLTKHEYDPKDPKSKKPIEILENIFDISENNKKESEEVEFIESTTGLECNDDNSFDLKFYPKLYKQYFGALPQVTTSITSVMTGNNNKRFNTDELIECLSRDANTPEQKIKFHLARYMAWKYFYKLKVNFTCDICEILLVGNRYQCIDCRDFSMCFTCFSKSCVDFKSNYTKVKSDDEDKNSNNKKDEQHKPEHRVLLLDHCCDNCGALIVGKRIHCEQCEDYDLCLMCHKMFDKSNNNEDDSEELSTSQQQNQIQQHNKSHKFIIIEPNIYHGKLLKNTNLQLYIYLHSQILFSIITLKLTRLLAYSTNVNSQEKASLMINDDLVYYKDINLLHSNYIRIIINCLNHIYSPKLYLSNGAAKQKLEIFSTYSQEILMGLLTTIIQSNATNLFDNSTKFSINDSIKAISANYDSEHIFTLYELIYYLVNIIIKRNDHYYEENIIYMVINSIIKLLEYSEPHKVDIIMYYLNNKENYDYKTDSLELDIENCIKTETGFCIEGELTLDFIIEWINQGVQSAQIDLIYNYIKLICKLNLNKNWKPAVDSIFNRLLASLLEINNKNENKNCENEQKILNFLCALIFTPVIVFSGQWIEYKKANDEIFNQSSSPDDISAQQSEFRNGLIKSHCYDETSNGYNLTIIDLVSRNSRFLKGLQADIDFKRSSNIAQFDGLQLSLENCSMIIKLYKNLLAFNNNTVVQYTNFKQLTLKQNIILLSISILLKEYQYKYADYIQNKNNDRKV